MHEETKKALDTIAQLEGIQSRASTVIQDIKDRCQHHDKVPTLIETLRYEFTPVLECVVCKKSFDEATEYQKISLIKTWYSDGLDIQLSEEQIHSKKNGFNLERPSFYRS